MFFELLFVYAHGAGESGIESCPCFYVVMIPVVLRPLQLPWPLKVRAFMKHRVQQVILPGSVERLEIIHVQVNATVPAWDVCPHTSDVRMAFAPAV